MGQHIWSQYAEQTDALVGEAIKTYRAVVARGTLVEQPAMAVEYETREECEVLAVATKRLNQDNFRKLLLEVYDYQSQ